MKIEECKCKTGESLISVSDEMAEVALYYDLRFDIINNELDVVITNADTNEILESSVSISFCPFCGDKL